MNSYEKGETILQTRAKLWRQKIEVIPVGIRGYYRNMPVEVQCKNCESVGINALRILENALENCHQDSIGILLAPFDTYHEKIRVKIEVLNEDVARVFFVDKNDIPIDDLENVVFMNEATKNKTTAILVEDIKSYLITWMNSYELSENF